MSRISRVLALVVLFAVGGVVVPSAAAATLSYAFTSADVGFVDGGGAPGAQARLAAMDDYVGAKKPVVRLDLFWSDVQPCATCAMRWSRLDPLVNTANARGMRVLLILDYGVGWANGGHDESWFPTNDTAWAGLVDAAVTHFGGKVQAYEVWNEPNISGHGNYGDNSVNVRAGRYWQLAKIAYQHVHAGCGSCVVLAGGSASGDSYPVNGTLVNDNEASDWLEWAYTHGMGGYFDAVTYHPYPDWNSGHGPSYAPTSCAQDWYRFWTPFGPDDPTCGGLAALREVMVRHGDTAKKIWATEFGFPSTGSRVPVSRDDVRDALEEGVRLWRSLDYTGPLFLYSFQDSPRTDQICVDSPNDGECHFGLRDADGNPKEPMYSDVRVALIADGWLPSLPAGRSLFRGSALRCDDGRFYLWLQSDGTLVLYQILSTGDRALWARGNLRGYRLANQHDGNLVLYDRSGDALWASDTQSRGDSTLWMQEDGNLVLYPLSQPETASWASNTVVGATGG